MFSKVQPFFSSNTLALPWFRICSTDLSSVLPGNLATELFWRSITGFAGKSTSRVEAVVWKFVLCMSLCTSVCTCSFLDISFPGVSVLFSGLKNVYIAKLSYSSSRLLKLNWVSLKSDCFYPHPLGLFKYSSTRYSQGRYWAFENTRKHSIWKKNW